MNMDVKYRQVLGRLNIRLLVSYFVVLILFILPACQVNDEVSSHKVLELEKEIERIELENTLLKITIDSIKLEVENDVVFQSVFDNKYIELGKSIGFVTNFTTIDDLIEIYGKKNINDEVVYSSEGNDVFGTKITFPEPSNSLFILWKDQNVKSNPGSVWTVGEAWQIKNIKVGTTLSEVETLNTVPFILNNLEIDAYLAGTVDNWNDGKLDDLDLQFEVVGQFKSPYHETSGIQYSDTLVSIVDLKVKQLRIRLSPNYYGY